VNRDCVAAVPPIAVALIGTLQSAYKTAPGSISEEHYRLGLSRAATKLAGW